MIPSASFALLGIYPERVSNMYTTPHSLQSFIAVNSFCTNPSVNLNKGYPLISLQIDKDAMALDTTVALPSFSRFYSSFKKPAPSIKSGAISYNLGTQSAPVFLTYAS